MDRVMTILLNSETPAPNKKEYCLTKIDKIEVLGLLIIHSALSKRNDFDIKASIFQGCP